jgi:N-methylhydantoinase A
LFSAFGLLYADVEHHYSRILRRLLRQVDVDDLNAAWERMVAEAVAQLTADGFTARQQRICRTVTMLMQRPCEIPSMLPPLVKPSGVFFLP